MKRLIKSFFLGSVALLLLSFPSCDPDDNTTGEEPIVSELDSVVSVKTKIREKITYNVVDNSERFKERWNYDTNRRDTLYELYEDGYIIERHLNYQYGAENNLYTKKYTRKLYLMGYQTAYLTENVTLTYIDSSMTKLLEEVHIGKTDSTRMTYKYNESGLCESVSNFENGELKVQTGNYVYGSKKCSYVEKYKSYNNWNTWTYIVDYANIYYTLVERLSVYKGTSNDERDLYERTVYEYNSIGQITKKEYYNGPSLAYSYSDYQYEGNKVTYTHSDFTKKETYKIVEILLDL